MRYLKAVGLTFVPILKILISLLDSSLKRVEVYSGTGAMGQQQMTEQDHPLTTLSSALMATTYLLGRKKVKQGKRHNYGHHSYSRINQGIGGFRLFNSFPLPIARDCRLRFFAHMHGQGVGNLTVFARDGEGSLRQLHQEQGAQPDMDINAWRRIQVNLRSCFFFFKIETQVELEDIIEEVQIIIEATVGVPGHGKMLTPKNKYALIPFEPHRRHCN